jgi:hypothetical protein
MYDYIQVVTAIRGRPLVSSISCPLGVCSTEVTRIHEQAVKAFGPMTFSYATGMVSEKWDWNVAILSGESDGN